ncbi:flagellar assembly protein FliW [Wukongibacter baidiensis]|uniref:flagellar assembly protein FliW n=1 Tax=Wukongibacter baidiensis TaxID=1723361 RepID=UPI003D7FFCE3
MKLNTKHFGEIEINEENIISFPEGIPAFENVKKYVIIQNPNPELPFNWLQGVDEPNLTFVIVNPFLFKADYEFDIPQPTMDFLSIEKQEDIFICCIVSVPENIADTTMNLEAPIIINNKSNKGKQIVLDNGQYDIRYKIFKKLES